MPPRTRKKPPRGSYAEEPESPPSKNTFDELFKIAKGDKVASDDEDSDYGNDRRSKRARKARNTPARKPELSISDHEDESGDEAETLLADTRKESRQATLTPLSINLQLPVHLTQTNISINLDNLIQMAQSDQSTVRIDLNGNVTAVDHSKRICLIDSLPVELRTRIWRFLFVTREPIHFTQRKGFRRSAQALRTSRIIHDEGTRVLYGENCFHFERACATRGKYWDTQWKEIGFKDVHRFLCTIGENKKKMKYISFKCGDAMPADTPYLSPSERRVVNDVALRQCLQMIADNTVLERFGIGAYGRTTFSEDDVDFLRALTGIQCHELAFTKCWDGRKIGDNLMDKIRKLMLVQPRDQKAKNAVRVQMPFEYREYRMEVVW